MADPPLAEFVAAVSIAESESAAAVAGVDRAAEALDAVVAAIVWHGEIIAAIGYPDATAPSDELEAVQPGSKGHPSTCPASARARRRLLRSSIRPAPRSGSREQSWPWREQQQESAVGAGVDWMALIGSEFDQQAAAATTYSGRRRSRLVWRPARQLADSWERRGMPTPDRSCSSSACARDANEPDGRAGAALQVSLSAAPAASPGSSPGAIERSE